MQHIPSLRVLSPGFVRSSKTFTTTLVVVKVFFVSWIEKVIKMKIFALVLFALMYVLMIAVPKYRPFYALTVAVVFLISGILPPDNLLSTINWNVLLMIAGTMIIVYYFIDSRMPNLLADILLGKSKNVMWVTILMSLFSGVISAFIDNVATVLMVAPCRNGNLQKVED